MTIIELILFGALVLIGISFILYAHIATKRNRSSNIMLTAKTKEYNTLNQKYLDLMENSHEQEKQIQTFKNRNLKLSQDKERLEENNRILRAKVVKYRPYSRTCPHCKRFLKKSHDGDSCYHCNKPLNS